MSNSSICVTSKNLSVKYAGRTALKDISMDIYRNNVTAIIGASGCGKSSFLRCINRMNDTVDNCSILGSLIVNGQEINDNKVDVVELRSKVGMVFQKPNPFPKSIFDNIAYGLEIHGLCSNKQEIKATVVDSLEKTGLYDEVQNRLHSLATGLSGGQQQRLCIARTVAIKPNIILMDEPCSALDPIATAKVEELIVNLKKNFTIIIVTHSMQQAARISDYTAFFHMGEIVEYDTTNNIFTNPKLQQTQDYITGRFG